MLISFHSLCDTNGKIIITATHIIPTNFLAHERLKIFNANPCNLPKCRPIEGINSENSSNQLNKCVYCEQNCTRYSIIDDLYAVFFPRCICPTFRNDNKINYYDLKLQYTFTYKILPPPNMGKKMVGELVPLATARSTNNVVNSLNTINSTGTPNAFTNVHTLPIINKIMSHVVV